MRFTQGSFSNGIVSASSSTYSENANKSALEIVNFDIEQDGTLQTRKAFGFLKDISTSKMLYSKYVYIYNVELKGMYGIVYNGNVTVVDEEGNTFSTTYTSVGNKVKELLIKHTVCRDKKGLKTFALELKDKGNGLVYLLTMRDHSQNFSEFTQLFKGLDDLDKGRITDLFTTIDNRVGIVAEDTLYISDSLNNKTIGTDAIDFVVPSTPTAESPIQVKLASNIKWVLEHNTFIIFQQTGVYISDFRGKSFSYDNMNFVHASALNVSDSIKPVMLGSFVYAVSKDNKKIFVMIHRYQTGSYQFQEISHKVDMGEIRGLCADAVNQRLYISCEDEKVFVIHQLISDPDKLEFSFTTYQFYYLDNRTGNLKSSLYKINAESPLPFIGQDTYNAGIQKEADYRNLLATLKKARTHFEASAAGKALFVDATQDATATPNFTQPMKNLASRKLRDGSFTDKLKVIDCLSMYYSLKITERIPEPYYIQSRTLNEDKVALGVKHIDFKPLSQMAYIEKTLGVESFPLISNGSTGNYHYIYPNEDIQPASATNPAVDKGWGNRAVEDYRSLTSSPSRTVMLAPLSAEGSFYPLWYDNSRWIIDFPKSVSGINQKYLASAIRKDRADDWEFQSIWSTQEYNFDVLSGGSDRSSDAWKYPNAPFLQSCDSKRLDKVPADELKSLLGNVCIYILAIVGYTNLIDDSLWDRIYLNYWKAVRRIPVQMPKEFFDEHDRIINKNERPSDKALGKYRFFGLSSKDVSKYNSNAPEYNVSTYDNVAELSQYGINDLFGDSLDDITKYTNEPFDKDLFFSRIMLEDSSLVFNYDTSLSTGLVPSGLDETITALEKYLANPSEILKTSADFRIYDTLRAVIKGGGIQTFKSEIPAGFYDPAPVAESPVFVAPLQTQAVDIYGRVLYTFPVNALEHYLTTQRYTSNILSNTCAMLLSGIPDLADKLVYYAPKGGSPISPPPVSSRVPYSKFSTVPAIDKWYKQHLKYKQETINNCDRDLIGDFNRMYSDLSVNGILPDTLKANSNLVFYYRLFSGYAEYLSRALDGIEYSEDVASKHHNIDQVYINDLERAYKYIAAMFYDFVDFDTDLKVTSDTVFYGTRALFDIGQFNKNYPKIADRIKAIRKIFSSMINNVAPKLTSSQTISVAPVIHREFTDGEAYIIDFFKKKTTSINFQAGADPLYVNDTSKGRIIDLVEYQTILTSRLLIAYYRGEIFDKTGAEGSIPSNVSNEINAAISILKVDLTSEAKLASKELEFQGMFTGEGFGIAAVNLFGELMNSFIYIQNLYLSRGYIGEAKKSIDNEIVVILSVQGMKPYSMDKLKSFLLSDKKSQIVLLLEQWRRQYSIMAISIYLPVRIYNSKFAPNAVIEKRYVDTAGDVMKLVYKEGDEKTLIYKIQKEKSDKILDETPVYKGFSYYAQESLPIYNRLVLCKPSMPDYESDFSTESLSVKGLDVIADTEGELNVSTADKYEDITRRLYRNRLAPKVFSTQENQVREFRMSVSNKDVPNNTVGIDKTTLPSLKIKDISRKFDIKR